MIEERRIDTGNAELRGLSSHIGTWAILPGFAEIALSQVESVNWTEHAKHAATLGAGNLRGGYELADGTAIVEISGPMSKFGSSIFGGTSTLAVRQSLKSALADHKVERVLLLIDSPGGTVAGTDDLAEAVRAANQKKPVFAYVEDLGASAAYWVASQTRAVYTNRMARVGSIGTYAVVHDSSKQAENEGIKTFVFSTGDYKGAGVPGSELTEEQQAEFQNQVEKMNDFFLNAVATGRRMSRKALSEIADGRVFIAEEARKLGLIDGIGTLDETLARIATSTDTTHRANAGDTYTTLEGSDMADDRFEALRAALPDASAEFLVEAYDGRMSTEAAQAAWIQKVQARAEEAERRLASQQIGNEPIVAGRKRQATASISAAEEFADLIQELVETGLTRQVATRRVIGKHPDLHQAYIEEFNELHERG